MTGDDITARPLEFIVELRGTTHWVVWPTGHKQTATQNEVKLWNEVKRLEAFIKQSAGL